MKYVKISFILLVSALGLGSCVSSTQYNSLNSDYRLLMDDRNRINERMNNLANENADLKRRLQELEETAKKYETTEAERISLQKQLVELQGLMDRSRRQNIKETGSMSIEIQRTREELQKREDDLAAKLRELQQMQDEMEKRNKRLMELETVLARKDSMVTALRRKVSDALLGFEGKGLSVHTKNGKVYVSMEDKLLFRSGRYDIEARGASAIKDLALMLAQNPEINVLIEGHTDDVTYRGTGDLKDNWDLSVKRATSVVRELLKNSQIDARRITAAGRGEFIPLDNAKTADARQKNRRIEIILTPKLDELFEILE
ncbi:MAG: OmpA family protein [Prevotellaceae bacterium]|jgi:chemotaxis protein MotB|nr:OmpA family protein [Prevotellaceae bacterium]